MHDRVADSLLMRERRARDKEHPIAERRVIVEVENTDIQRTFSSQDLHRLAKREWLATIGTRPKSHPFLTGMSYSATFFAVGGTH